MESMKEYISSWLKSFKDYINSFSFVEKEKNIFYFSKFSLDISEFFLIHDFIKKLKENIFKENMEQFKYCVKNIIIFNDQNNNNNKDLNEKEKIIILFSACLFIYYKKFRFNTNGSFDSYFDNDFILIAKNIFKFEIKNNEIFKIFAFYYFSIMQKQIQALDYTKIKNIKKYYNYSALEKNEEKEEENINMINGGTQNIKEGFQEQVLTFLISTKEKMLELVYTTNKNKNNINDLFPEEIKDMNTRFQKLNNNLNFYIDNNEKKTEEKNIIQINQNQNQINDSSSDTKSDMIIEDVSPQKIKNFCINIKNNNISLNNKNENLFKLDGNNNIINNNNVFGNETHSNKFSLMQTDYSNDNHINFTNENIFNKHNQKKPIIENYNSMYLNLNKKNPLVENLDLNLSNSNSNSLEKSFDSLFNFSSNSLNNINLTNKDSSNIYSKKVISELIKSEFDKNTMEIIEEVSKIIDEKYLDTALNTSQKTVCLIQYYCCYMVEFTPEMLQNICPKYKDILQNFDIKFIVLAKELYNTTMEIFSTIYDLSYTNFDTFIELTKDCGIQLEHAQGLYKIFREYSIMLLNEKKRKKNMNANSNKYIMNVLRKLFDNEYQNWTNIIKQKSNEFTNFFKM
jgi:hypothetical protein